MEDRTSSPSWWESTVPSACGKFVAGRKDRKVIKRNGALELDPIYSQSLQAQAYDSLRKAIIQGTFEPGQKLSTRKLATAFQISEMPVRHALARLLTEKALVQNENGTYSVPLVIRERFRDIMRTRALVEAEAARTACGHVTAAGFAELHRLSGDISSAINARNIECYLKCNAELKHLIYSFCPSPLIRETIDSLWLRCGPLLRHLSGNLPNVDHGNFHDDAIAALEAGDAAAAGFAISRDILAGLTILEKYGRFADDIAELGLARKGPA